MVEGRPRAMIEIQLQDGRTFPGRVEDLDKLSDLATVRIDCKNLPVIRLGNSSDIRPGEFVVALGSPLALSNTITTGVVSTVARDQKVHIYGSFEKQQHFYPVLFSDLLQLFLNILGPQFL